MFKFSNCFWFFNCFSRYIASGVKQILLMINCQPQNHHLAQRQRDLKMCFRLQLTKDLSNQMKAKRGRWRKKLFDFSRVDVPLTTNHLIDTSTTVPHYFLALPSVLHMTKPAHLRWMIEGTMKQWASRRKEGGSPCHVWPQGNIL